MEDTLSAQAAQVKHMHWSSARRDCCICNAAAPLGACCLEDTRDEEPPDLQDADHDEQPGPAGSTVDRSVMSDAKLAMLDRYAMIVQRSGTTAQIEQFEIQPV